MTLTEAALVRRTVYSLLTNENTKQKVEKEVPYNLIPLLLVILSSQSLSPILITKVFDHPVSFVLNIICIYTKGLLAFPLPRITKQVICKRKLF